MADRWIVSSYRFQQHGTLSAAEDEQRRLRGRTGKPFYIYRIKTTLNPSRSGAVIARQMGALQKIAAECEDLAKSEVIPNGEKITYQTIARIARDGLKEESA